MSNPRHISNLEVVSESDFSSWQWQLRNALRDVDSLNGSLAKFSPYRIELSHNSHSADFPFKVTPHMIEALREALESHVDGAWEAFRWSFVMQEAELRGSDNEGVSDGIGEESTPVNPVASITNFYRSRVLFRVTLMCPAYCRYCFRRRMVGEDSAWDQRLIDAGLAYISSNPSIREVVLSGGEPLILSDRRLSYILDAIRKMPHIRRVRIDTKALTMMPQRFTANLLQLLQSNQPLYLIAHFTHLSELSSDTKIACSRIADAGIPIRSHTPLLRMVNDSETALADLMECLVDHRVQPYYLIHFIPTKWTEHFRVPLARGLELMRYIHRTCDGLATPTYIVYLPESGGKVPFGPEFLQERTASGYIFENLEGRRILFPE